MLLKSWFAFSLKVLFAGDVVEQMDAEHLLFCPLHWTQNLEATKIQQILPETTSCKNKDADLLKRINEWVTTDDQSSSDH